MTPDQGREQLAVACPCCHGNKIDVDVAKHRFALASHAGIDVTISAQFHSCATCTHIWMVDSAGKLSEELLLDYYMSKQYVPPEASFPESPQGLELERLASLVALLAGHNRPDETRRVLEVGGGDASFAHAYARQSPSFLEKYLVYEMGDYGMVVNDPVVLSRSPADFVDEKFDLVVIRHTLEHVMSLDTFINSLAKNLSLGGLVYIEVPCWSTPFQDVDQLNAEHIHYFSHSSVDWLFLRNGWHRRADFSISMRDYFTPNRIMGKFFSMDGAQHVESLTTTGAEIYSNFQARISYDRASLVALADRILSLLADGVVVVVHGATITLLDFLLNEGAAILDSPNLIVADGNVAKAGSTLLTKTVETVSEALSHDPVLVVMFSSFTHQISQTWRESGYSGPLVYYLEA